MYRVVTVVPPFNFITVAGFAARSFSRIVNATPLIGFGAVAV